MIRARLLAASAASVLTIATGALAQTAATTKPASQKSADAPSTTIGEIVVTAERREANLQDVPEAVTAFTAQDRNIKGIETVQDMTDFTPGFTYSSQLDRPAMRGLSRNTNIYLQDSSVAVYYDDFFSNSTFLVGRDDMVIDQVEILEGPQGTLYGRNAIGGLINTISKRPTDELSGEVRAIVGNYGYTKFEGTVSGPLLPHLDFRMSLIDENQTQGWLDNVYPGSPSEGGIRHDPYGDFQLQYKNDHDEIWFDTYVVGFNHDRGGPGSLLGTPTAGSYGTVLTGISQLGFNPNYPYNPANYEVGTSGGIVPGSVVGLTGTDNPVVTSGNLREFSHNIPTDITVNKAYTFTLHWTHHFDGFDVKYVGGYSQYHYKLRDPYFANDNSSVSQYTIQPTTTVVPIGLFVPGAPGSAPLCALYGGAFHESAAVSCSPLTVYPSELFGYETQTDWSSHEITFSSTTNGPIQWIAGLYYYWETDNNPVTNQLVQQTQYLQPYNGTLTGLAPANPGSYQFFLDYQDRLQSAASYAQVDWKILPRLKLTGGLRYTFDWKHGTEETRYVFFGSTGAVSPLNIGAGLPAIDLTQSLISFAPAPGVCSLPTLQTTGPYAGDYARCLSTHSEALTGTAGIEWTPNDDTLVYARYNRGYKAAAFYGGYINAAPLAAPEHVDDFEVGYKATFNRTFTIDADAFYYNYANDQVPLGATVQGSSGVSTVSTTFINIPKAVSDGVELTAYWRPIRHLDLSLTYGLDHTEITSNCALVDGVATGACYEDVVDPYALNPQSKPLTAPVYGTTAVQSVHGNPLPQAPENKVAFNANYTFEFEPGNLILSATYIWKDKSYDSIFPRTFEEAPSWDQVDMRATWSGHHDRYEIILYVRNLFNTYGYDAAASGYLIQNPVSNVANPYSQVSAFDLTPPRTFGAEFHYKF
jgi:iron complex outermembrane receptor protein